MIKADYKVKNTNKNINKDDEVKEEKYELYSLRYGVEPAGFQAEND